jgi:hypothetical protein
MRNEMTKIFHIVLDQKFIDNAISIFDGMSGIQNEYLLVSRTGKVSLISSKKRIMLFKSQCARLRYVFAHTPDIIILHSLFFGATLVPIVARAAALVWISWGQDLYRDEAEAFSSSYPMRHSLFMEETRKWRQSQKVAVKSRAARATKSLVRNIFRLSAIRRIEYVSTCLPYEFPIVQSKYPHVKQFNFDYIDKTALALPRCNGLSILVGNSGSINCNHLDIIKTLADRHLKIERIITPLSYAGGEAYKSEVIKEGKKAFGDKFLPLLSFMRIKEYTDLLRSCGIAILGFMRQQATKNIQLLLSQGTKIFFYKNAEMFRFFKESGYSVFSIEDDLTDSALSALLSEAEVTRNQRLLARDFGFDQNLSKVNKSIEAILARRT